MSLHVSYFGPEQRPAIEQRSETDGLITEMMCQVARSPGIASTTTIFHFQEGQDGRRELDDWRLMPANWIVV